MAVIEITNGENWFKREVPDELLEQVEYLVEVSLWYDLTEEEMDGQLMSIIQEAEELKKEEQMEIVREEREATYLADDWTSKEILSITEELIEELYYTITLKEPEKSQEQLEEEIGNWGIERNLFLKERAPRTRVLMIQSDQLKDHLISKNREAEERLKSIKGVSWHTAEELMRAEVICS